MPSKKIKTEGLTCRHCGEPVRKFTGAISEWWVHDRTRSQACTKVVGKIAKP